MAKKVLGDLNKVMELMGEAYYFSKEVTADMLTETTDILDSADFEMPLSDEGVTFEVGDPDITRKKITERRNWITYAKRGDDNISFQVPSFDDSLNELFMNKVTKTAVKAKIGEDVHEGAGYSLKPKKIVGAWVFRNPEHTITVLMPLTENYGTFKGAQGDTEGYYNVAVTPMAATNNVEIYILHKTEAGAEAGA